MSPIHATHRLSGLGIAVLTVVIWVVWRFVLFDSLYDPSDTWSIPPTPPGLLLAPLLALLGAQGIWAILAGIYTTITAPSGRFRLGGGKLVAVLLLALLLPVANIDGFPVSPLLMTIFGPPPLMAAIVAGLCLPLYLVLSLTGATGGWGLTVMFVRLWLGVYGVMLLLQGLTPLDMR